MFRALVSQLSLVRIIIVSRRRRVTVEIGLNHRRRISGVNFLTFVRNRHRSYGSGRCTSDGLRSSSFRGNVKRIIPSIYIRRYGCALRLVVNRKPGHAQQALALHVPLKTGIFVNNCLAADGSVSAHCFFDDRQRQVNVYHGIYRTAPFRIHGSVARQSTVSKSRTIVKTVCKGDNFTACGRGGVTINAQERLSIGV